MTLYDRCKEFGALPYAGGMVDQDDRVMRLMATCVNVRYLFNVKYEDYNKLDAATFQYIDQLRTAARDG